MRTIALILMALAPEPVPTRADPSAALITRTLAGLPTRPSITQVQSAAIARMAVSARTSRRWLRRARAAAILPTVSAELNLQEDNLLQNTLNVPSTLFPDAGPGEAPILIIPGDPANSYMMVMLGSYDWARLGESGTMPFNNPILCKEKRDAVERWIMALVPVDAGPDGGMGDGGITDAGAPDAGAVDASVSDGGSVQDAGVADASAVDSAAVDAAAIDANPVIDAS